MKLLTAFITSLFVTLYSNAAFAETHVCIDKAGNKSFSATACEKSGLKTTTADFPQVSSVFIVPDDAPKKSAEKPSTNNSEAKISPWTGTTSLPGFMFFFIVLMPLAAIFCLSSYMFMYIRARMRKFRHVKKQMHD